MGEPSPLWEDHGHGEDCHPLGGGGTTTIHLKGEEGAVRQGMEDLLPCVR